MEKAITQVLYRQSSLETRLSPVPDSDSSLSSEDETIAAPRVIGVKLKASIEKIEPICEAQDQANDENKLDGSETPVYLIKGK